MSVVEAIGAKAFLHQNARREITRSNQNNAEECIGCVYLKICVVFPGLGGEHRKENECVAMKWEGFAYAAGAAVGHSCIDVARKMASQYFSPAELIALVGLLDAIFLCGFLWIFGPKETIGSLTSVWEERDGDERLLRILVISAGLKVMAGFMYQRALQVSPMSVTIPYLAFTPVMLVFTSYFLMNEMPSVRGLLGVVVVTVGGYMLVLDRPWDAHSTKITSRGGNQINGDETGHSLDGSWPADTKKLSSFKSFSRWVVSSHILEPLLALRREEGSLLMLVVAGVFSISNRICEEERESELVVK
ncbi:hypothetical protein KI387_001584 [Taxus chinensis]|uniref:EamA domain-containing protein n=1 Tax=Taxus chinensis TaxID=29808 RepID=A0AA38GUX2_TAXCH|nr:hypothetical protein KI387_001584 [Taxus chinensis]